MRLRSTLVGFAFLAAACGGKKAAVVPAPDAGGDPGTTTGTGTTTPTNPGTTNPGTSNPGTTSADMADLIRAMQEPVYFDYNEDVVKADGQVSLDRKATIMLANPALRIRIAGHADERGSDEYNIVLGTRRAAVAKRYLEAKGIDGSRIETLSYGEERPADNGESEAAFAKNRRDEFELTAGGDRLVKPK